MRVLVQISRLAMASLMLLSTSCGLNQISSRPLTKTERSEMLSMTLGVSEEEAQKIEAGLENMCSTIKGTQNQRKFLCTIAQSAIVSNEKVFGLRLSISESKSTKCSDPDFSTLCRSYKLPAIAEKVDLLKRVNIVPLSILAAQAAIESGWGTSRFATEGFNFFGRHANCTEKGAITTATPEVCLRRYSSLDAGVKDQIHYWNTVPAAYGRNFRNLRALQQISGKFNSQELATALLGYAEAGGYVEKVQRMLQQFALETLDKSGATQTANL